MIALLVITVNNVNNVNIVNSISIANIITTFNTRSYAVADLDWIVEPGYSWDGYICHHLGS